MPLLALPPTPGRATPDRHRPPEESLDLFRRMRAGLTLDPDPDPDPDPTLTLTLTLTNRRGVRRGHLFVTSQDRLRVLQHEHA